MTNATPAQQTHEQILRLIDIILILRRENADKPRTLALFLEGAVAQLSELVNDTLYPHGLENVTTEEIETTLIKPGLDFMNVAGRVLPVDPKADELIDRLIQEKTGPIQSKRIKG